ncbi:mechanosensitive ion channel domain-containing protein [Pelagibius sp. 7325]|uniref:mechanosensitive ion channel domain-containing protein n=1 Tax=Pelagibius sp. 7325 TaxID=3131994 RepID=UPI0030EE5BB4
MPRRLRHLLRLLIVCLGLAAPAILWVPAPSAAQTPGQTAGGQAAGAQGVAVSFEAWQRSLDLVDQQLSRVDTTAESATRFFEVTAEVRQEAAAAIAAMQPRVDSVQRRLDALGPPPGEGEESEAPQVAQQRAKLREELQQVNGQITQAKLAMVRADELDALIGSLSQRKRFEALFRSYPFPWAPETWREGVPEFFAIVEEMARSPVEWWDSVSGDERHQALSARIAVLLTLALLGGGVLRYWLIRRFGRDPAVAEPHYGTRLVAAIASAAARGIVPALVFAGLFYMVWSNHGAEETLFWTLLMLLFAVMAFFSLAWALPYAVLSPDLPQWRLLPVSPDNARILGRRLILLAALFAVQIFMAEAQREIGVSDAYFSLSTFLLNLLPALLLIDTSRPRYWLRDRSGAAEEEEAGEDEDDNTLESTFWRAVRRLIALAAFFSILASLVGYADLAAFLVQNLLISLVTLSGLAILRGLMREVIGAWLRSGFMREALEIRHVARNRIKFWVRALLDVVLIVFGTVIIASIWFSPFGEFWTEARRLLSGVTIGGVTISFSDMLVALVIFAAILLLTRLFQRVLRSRVLPQTGFDSGVQNSLSAGFGYIGVILAVVFGISALGVDLSNIALIAGALSVGIGFGLQTVVSNFVSGIILLIERPIKVGDWVMVGGNEGTVKQITVRSTELQTFQRASVIIPNSDFISTSVINWTHKDHYGRIEVAVGVAYGSDVEKVRAVLLDCAQKHEQVLTSPEPQVLFMNFGASSLDFELRCFTNEVSYRLSISSDLRFAIDKAFRDAGIEIPFPQHVVHFADPAQGAKVTESKDKSDRSAPPA